MRSLPPDPESTLKPVRFSANRRGLQESKESMNQPPPLRQRTARSHWRAKQNRLPELNRSILLFLAARIFSQTLRSHESVPRPPARPWSQGVSPAHWHSNLYLHA